MTGSPQPTKAASGSIHPGSGRWEVVEAALFNNCVPDDTHSRLMLMLAQPGGVLEGCECPFPHRLAHFSAAKVHLVVNIIKKIALAD
jgi:hypothetical protein